MSRPLRIELPGANYHVTSRGKDGQTVFKDKEDFGVFLNTVEHVVDRFGWLLHSYVLMKDHYHLVVELPEANLSRGMRQLNGIYTQHVNRRHGTGGPIFHGRFKSILFEKKTYLLPICRHVVTHPTRLQGTSKSGSYGTYPWSSYRATAGQVKAPAWLYTDDVLKDFPGQGKASQKRYRDYIKAGVHEPSPIGERSSQVLLGSQSFLNKMKPILQQGGPPRIGPKAAARRLSLSSIFKRAQGMTRNERNALIRQAHLAHGYTLKEIGGHLGLHYTTVSKVISATKLASLPP